MLRVQGYTQEWSKLGGDTHGLAMESAVLLGGCCSCWVLGWVQALGSAKRLLQDCGEHRWPLPRLGGATSHHGR